jgi:ATP-dependent Clp protease adaptor protein ClpS
MKVQTATKSAQTADLLEQKVDQCDLIIYNDDVNTFDFVTQSLIKICKHDALQAEQCTMIIHYNGKCSVKRGSFEKLRAMCDALCDRGLSAEIQN